MGKNLPYNRAARVADEIRRIVSFALVSEISDPRLAGVQVTGVRMTPHLRIVRVYFHVDGEDRREKALKGFRSSSGYFKRLIGKEITLRFMPDFEYFYDEGIDLQEKMDELFDKIKR